MFLNLFDKITKLDKKVVYFLDTHCKNKYFIYFMRSITFLGDYGLIWLCIILFSVINPLYRVYGLVALSSFLTTLLLTEVLIKNIVKRIRPYKKLELKNLFIDANTSYSFPSGHAATSFSVVVVFFVFNTFIGYLVLLIASLISFSRVYLKVHYPSDVIVGAIIGTIVSWISCIVFL